jgi:hypothetical protein
MSPTAAAIRDALMARRTGLSDPASEQDLQRLEGALAVALNTHARQLYLTFNGFSAADENSQIRLWSLSEIANNKELCTEIGGLRYFPAGDFLIDSDVVMFPCETEYSPVVYLYERRQFAAIVRYFLE